MLRGSHRKALRAVPNWQLGRKLPVCPEDIGPKTLRPPHAFEFQHKTLHRAFPRDFEDISAGLVLSPRSVNGNRFRLRVNHPAKLDAMGDPLQHFGVRHITPVAGREQLHDKPGQVGFCRSRSRLSQAASGDRRAPLGSRKPVLESVTLPFPAALAQVRNCAVISVLRIPVYGSVGGMTSKSPSAVYSTR